MRGTEKILEQAVAYFNGQITQLWYSGYRETSSTTSTNISIGVATSGIGIHWTRYAGNPVMRPGPPGSWNELRVLTPGCHHRTGRLAPDGRLRNVHKKHPGKSAGSIGFLAVEITVIKVIVIPGRAKREPGTQ